MDSAKIQQQRFTRRDACISQFLHHKSSVDSPNCSRLIYTSRTPVITPWRSVAHRSGTLISSPSQARAAHTCCAIAIHSTCLITRVLDCTHDLLDNCNCYVNVCAWVSVGVSVASSPYAYSGGRNERVHVYRTRAGVPGARMKALLKAAMRTGVEKPDRKCYTHACTSRSEGIPAAVHTLLVTRPTGRARLLEL